MSKVFAFSTFLYKATQSSINKLFQIVVFLIIDGSSKWVFWILISCSGCNIFMILKGQRQNLSLKTMGVKPILLRKRPKIWATNNKIINLINAKVTFMSGILYSSVFAKRARWQGLNIKYISNNNIKYYSVLHYRHLSSFVRNIFNTTHIYSIQ